MKKLISLLCAMISSLFTGAEFQLPKEDIFIYSESAYFQPEVANHDIHYKSLYSQVFVDSSFESSPCDTTRYQATRESWSELSEIKLAFAPVTENPKSSLHWELTASAEISAPANGTIQTSHYACEYGSYMLYEFTLNGTTYQMEIEGAQCWFCCKHKPVPDDGRYTAATSDSLSGYKMRAGDVLCVGKAGTKITIVNSSD